jgi:hypothetical protein
VHVTAAWRGRSPSDNRILSVGSSDNWILSGGLLLRQFFSDLENAHSPNASRNGASDAAPPTRVTSHTSSVSTPTVDMPMTETPLTFDLTFNAEQHAASTVGDLRTAVHAMTSRWPTQMKCAGRELFDDALSLVQAGIGLQCTLEIRFLPLSPRGNGTAQRSFPPTPTSRGSSPGPSAAAAAAATAAAAGGVNGSSQTGSLASNSKAVMRDKRSSTGTGSVGTGTGVSTTNQGADDPMRLRGGLFHASISDAAGLSQRKTALRQLFDMIDTNGNGVVDRDELAVFVQWAVSASTVEPLHKRICALFLEGDSLERSFDRSVAGIATCCAWLCVGVTDVGWVVLLITSQL